MKWIKAGKGIRYFEHPSRRYGNHLDRYYSLFYKLKGKTYTESLGWESENRIPGQTMLQRAEEAMALIRQRRRTGGAPIIKKERFKEAEDKRIEEEKEKNKKAKDEMLLDEYYENYFRNIAESRLKAKSLQTELGHYNVWIKNILGNMPLKDISIEHWDLLIKSMKSSKLSQRTKRYICGTLCRILKSAKERGFSTSIPTFKMLGIQMNDNRRMRVLSPSELTNLLEEIKNLSENAYNFTLFAALTGCRFGEASNLKWNDIQNGKIIFKNTKNKSNRMISIPDNLSEILNIIREVSKSEYVFVNDRGEQYRNIPSAYINAVKKLNLNEGYDNYNRVCFHTLRHTAATYMAKYLDIRSLMDIFGWKSITMAARYMHGDEDVKKTAINSMGNMLLQKQGASIHRFPKKLSADGLN